MADETTTMWCACCAGPQGATPKVKLQGLLLPWAGIQAAAPQAPVKSLVASL